MNVTGDNSHDSGPIGCTFPLLLCYKIALSGKGKTESCLWLWEMSAVLREEAEKNTFSPPLPIPPQGSTPPNPAHRNA